MRSGRFVNLLITSSPSLLGYAVAFSPKAVAIHPISNKQILRSVGETSINAMADEIAAAKEAAANYKSSDADGAGPVTVFDKLLR